MSYQEYARQIIENYAETDTESRDQLVDSVKTLKVKRVLDVGCGAGHQLIPFAVKKDAFCVGIDIGEELGQVGNAFIGSFGFSGKICFARAKGEELPFENESFDVVLCMVALPYMHNKKAIAETARVLRPGGVYILKTHAPAFYFGMLKRRFRTFDLRQYAYPVICLINGIRHQLTGRQAQDGFWKGKEVFQTKGFLTKELKKHNLRIEGTLPDTNIQSPSFYIVKKLK